MRVVTAICSHSRGGAQAARDAAAHLKDAVHKGRVQKGEQSDHSRSKGRSCCHPLWVGFAQVSALLSWVVLA